MRKWGVFLFLLACVQITTGCILYHPLTTLKDMYARDTQLRYEQGVADGIEQAVDSSPDVEALTTLFARYSHADAPNFARWVVEYSAKYHVPSVIVGGMVCQESSCNPMAVSSCGARGLTQIRWKFWGTMLRKMKIATKESDLHNPRIAIEACACILRYLLDKHDGDLHEALRHYSGDATKYVEKVIGRVVG